MSYLSVMPQKPISARFVTLTDCGKMQELVLMAQIYEFCEFCDGRKKITAIVMHHLARET